MISEGNYVFSYHTALIQSKGNLVKDHTLLNQKNEGGARSCLASIVCKLGAWLIKRGFQIDHNGGAAVVVVVHGSKHLSMSWHLGWTSQAQLAAALAQSEADALIGHAMTLEEINNMTNDEIS